MVKLKDIIKKEAKKISEGKYSVQVDLGRKIGSISLKVDAKDEKEARALIAKGLKNPKDIKKIVKEFKLNEREPVAKEKDMIKKLDNAYSFYLKFSKEIRDASKNVAQADYKEIERGMSFVSRDSRRVMDRLEKAIKKAKKLNILEW